MEIKPYKDDKSSEVRTNPVDTDIRQKGSPPSTPPVPVERCRICNGALAPIWPIVQIRDRFKTRYRRCKKCWSLQLVGLEWIRDAYWGDTSIRHDEGRRLRNRIVFSFLDHVQHMLWRREKINLLDYGSGSEKILENFINKFTKETYKIENYDPYVNGLEALPEGKFHAITCIEVLEHLSNVQAFYEHIRQKLHRNSILICSTEIHIPFGPSAHGKTWQYLTKSIGQHITFWTRRSLKYMKGAVGADKCAIVRFPNKIALQIIVFCKGTASQFLDMTKFKVIEL
jgi:hypothetical protein